MEYGLRRYEAVQRLIWLVFFIFCLGASYWMQDPAGYRTPTNPHIKDVKTLKFWTGLHGILMASPTPDHAREKIVERNEPSPGGSFKKQGLVEKNDAAPKDSSQTDPQILGRIMLFIVRAGLIFLVGRMIWLIFQYVGKFLLKVIIEEKIKAPGQAKAEYSTAPIPVSFFPRQLLLDEVRHFRFSFLFHPFRRLRLMLSGSQKSISSEELLEKERRIVESDWEILHSSWGPFRWMFWILPVLGLAQTGWFLFIHLQNASTSQKEILDTLQTIPNSLLPLIQAGGLVVFFKLAAALVRRLEELYLSNLDALIFDRLLSKLPFQSNDTLIILETLQRQFRELHLAVRRLELAISPEKKPGGQK